MATPVRPEPNPTPDRNQKYEISLLERQLLKGATAARFAVAANQPG